MKNSLTVALDVLKNLSDTAHQCDAHAYLFVRSRLALPRTFSVFKKDVRLNESINFRLYRPEHATGSLGGIVFTHGGGWHYGSPDSHDAFCTQLCAETQMNIYSLDYGLCPALTYPGTVTECTSMLRHLLEHKANYYLNDEELYFCGDSAGGNLAAALAIYCRESNINCSGQILMYPILNTDITAYIPNARKSPLYSLQQLSHHLSGYLPDSYRQDDWYASPSLYPTEKLAPTLLVSGTLDILFDENIKYHQKLLRSSAAVEHLILKGLPHGFITLEKLFPEVQDVIKHITTFIYRIRTKHEITTIPTDHI